MLRVCPWDRTAERGPPTTYKLVLSAYFSWCYIVGGGGPFKVRGGPFPKFPPANHLRRGAPLSTADTNPSQFTYNCRYVTSTTVVKALSCLLSTALSIPHHIYTFFHKKLQFYMRRHPKFTATTTRSRNAVSS